MKRALIVLLAVVALAVPIWLARAAATNVWQKPRITAPPLLSHSNTKRNLNPALVAGVIYVDDSWAGTTPGTDPDGAGPATSFGAGGDAFATIQDGINAATSGGTVFVYAGSYTEQVTISKNLTLTGENTATTVLHTPATLSPRIGGTFTLVQVDTSAVVNMSGLTISGPHATANGCADPVYYGIFVVGGANLNLHDAAMTDIRLSPNSLLGCQTGIAVRAGSLALGQIGTLTVNNVAITGYQKSAIIVDNTGSSGTITNNTITGLGPENIAANAIQIGRGAGATITGNNITANECTSPVCGPDPLTQTTSTGVLVFSTSATLQINNNTISNNDTGIYNNGDNTTVSGNTMVANRFNGIFQDEGSSTITGNTLTGLMNVGVATVSFNGNTGDSTATLTGNTIVGATTGLQLLDETNADAFGPQLTAHFNRIVSTTNSIGNMPVLASLNIKGDSVSSTHAAIMQAAEAIEGKSAVASPVASFAPKPSLVGTSNLENNWWGCNAGPGNPGCGGVTGSNVDFSPWFVVAAQAAPSSITPGATSNVSVDLTHNSDNAVPAFTSPDTPVSYNATNGTMTPPTGTITAGAASSQFTSTSTNSAAVTVAVDNQNLNLPITVTAPAFSIDDVTHVEGNPPGTTDYVFTVTKTGATGLSSSVQFQTVDGAATVADNDYVANSGTLNFGPSDTTMQVTVQVNHDFKPESDEAFTVHLFGEVGATISDADGTGTITNDDNQPNVVYVDDDFTGPIGSDPDGAGPATAIGFDAFKTIQEGVNAVAASGTVNVAAGTYTENVTIPKALTLTGAGAANVFLRPALSAPNPCSGASLCPGGSNMILVQASDVTISGLTLDGDNPNLTSSENFGGANIDARNGIITNHLSGVFNNLEVHHTAVKNIYLRGIYASSGGTFNFHDNTVQNVQADPGSISMFNFAGSGAFTNNNVSDSNDAISSNHSTGTTYTGNTITNSASGIHSDNAGDSGGTPDTISGNTVTNSSAFGFGIWVFVPYKTVTVQNNTVTNVDVGLAVFGDSGVTTTTAPTTSFLKVSNAKSGKTAPKSANTTEPDALIQSGLAAGKRSEMSLAAPAVAPFSASFTGNTVNGQNKANSTGAYFTTSQIGFGSGNPKVSATGNTIINNVDGFYLEAQDGFTLETAISFNRIVFNTNSGASRATGAGLAGTVNGSMENNWWGCNAGPNNTGCGSVVGAGIDFNPWIVLIVSAAPSSITPSGTSTLTADMTHNSDANVPVGVTALPLPNASFTATNGTILPASNSFTSGQSQSTFTSTNSSSSSACGTVDNEQQCTTINVAYPSFSIDDVTMAEGNAGTTSFTFTITKTGPGAASVDYATVNGTATAPADYTAIPTTTLSFLSGDVSKPVTVQVNGDTTFEANETFTVHLSNAINATTSDADGLGTINNDDTCGAFSTVYVDASWAGTAIGDDPDGAGPATVFGCDSFATIQEGINAVTAGGTVIVRAGTYKENPNANKAVTIQGPNVGTAGSATRVAEASVISSGNQNAVFTVSANNVTIDGFTIDGDDPLVTGTPLKSGDDTNVLYGVRPTGAFNHLTVQNNIVKRAFIGFRGDGASQNNLITANWFDSIGNFDFGYCVSLRTDFYAEITNNKMTRAWTGVHINDHHNAGGPASFNISNNEIHSYAGGILYWLNYNAATGASINGNTITAESGAVANNFGMLVVTLQNAVSTTITSNTISGHNYGVGLFNVPTSSTITLGSTNSISGSSLAGVFLTDNLNFNPIGLTNFLAGGPGAASTVNVSGLLISGNTGDGVKVEGATNAQTLNVDVSTITGTSGTKGVELVSPHSFINLTASTVTGFSTGVSLQNSSGATAHLNRVISGTTAIDNPNNQTVNLENNWWGCNAGPGNTGCGTVTGSGADFDPWIVLGVSASPASIAPGGTSTVTADMTHSSNSGTPAGVTTLPLPSAAFTATNGTMFPTANGFTSGQSQSTFTSTNASSSSACGTVDNEQQCTPITVTPPSFSINDVTLAEGNAGTTSFTFTITKTGAGAANVDYATVNGTATAPSDYTAIPTTTLNFLSGDTFKQVTVLVNGDTAVEANETFTVHLSNAINATISDTDGLGTITNDDTCGAFSTVYVNASWVGTAIGDDPDGAGPATVFGCDSFATIQGGVTAVTSGGTVIVAAGTYTENVTISKPVVLKGSQFGLDARGRSAAESIVSPASASSATFLLNATTTTTVIDGFSFTGGTSLGVIQTQSGSDFSNLQIRNNRFSNYSQSAVFLNRGGNDITIDKNVMDGSNISGSGQAIFGNGPQNFNGLFITNNNIINNTGRYGFFVDGNHNMGESATRAALISGNLFDNNLQGLNLGSRSFGKLTAPSLGTYAGTISNNTFSNNTANGIQAGIQHALVSGNTFTNNAVDGLALTSFGNTGADRGAQNSDIFSNTFTGQGRAGILFSGTQGVGLIETNKANFNRILGNAVGIQYGTSIATGNNATINVENNWWGCNFGPGAGGAGCTGTTNGTLVFAGNTGVLDSNPWIILGASASPASIPPGGTSTVTADMTRNSDNAGPLVTNFVPQVSVSFSATNGTIAPPTGTITSGQAQSTFTSTNFSTGQACGMVDGQQSCTSIPLVFPSFSIDDVTMAEGNAGTTSFTFTITKTGAGAASVDYATVNGTATAPSDYTAIPPTTLSFLSGDVSKQVTIQVNGDTAVEPDETFKVHLSNAINATISDADGLGTITNDDSCAPFSTVYVDDSWAGTSIGTDPDGAGPATVFGCDSFATIQEGITAVTSGGTVVVYAGTYAEQLSINKPVSVLGPNATINPNTGTRVAEATIIPTSSDPLNGSFNGPITVYLQVPGITFKGFTVDGDNPSLTSGVIFNGSDVDAEFGIYGDGAGDLNAVVENNIVQNVGEFGIWLNSFGFGGARNSNTHINQNKVDNILGVFGQAIRISDDCWADVTNNVATRVRNGIVIENYSGNVTTHPASIIDHNQVTSFRIGIRDNLHYVYSAPGFTISNNTVQPYVQSPMPSQVTTPTSYQGIRVESIQQTVAVTVQDNTLTGNKTPMQSGGYTRDEGLNVTNASTTSPNILFNHNDVRDFLLGAFQETPAVPDFECNLFTGNTTGIEIDAAASSGLIAHQNNIFANGAGMQNSSSATVNATNNYWGRPTGPTSPSNPGGTGDTVSTNVTFSPFLTAHASCAPVISYTITAAAGTNGSISPSGAVSVGYGESQTFNITPNPHYHIVDVQVDGGSVGAVPSYTFTDVLANHTISASFAITTHTITASAGANGSITPSGAVIVNDGADQLFNITANPSYHVQDVLVDSVSVGPVTSHTLTNVTADHTISATFALTCGTQNTVYVDDNWVGTTIGTDPDGAGPATSFGCDSFATIQEGVNAVAAGGTVNVAAGNYPENVTVPKSLSLLGPNASINPNTAVLLQPAVVRPAVTQTSLQGSTSGTIFRVGTGSGHINVTLKGFLIDGNNPLLTGGRMLNGIEVHTGAGIVNSIGSFDSNPGAFDTTMVVQNNVIRNLERYGVLADNVPARTPSAGNDISFNRFDNLPSGNNFGGERGRGIAFEENVYGSATFNVMNKVNVGWQDDNYNLASPGSGTLIDHNQIHAYHRGIFHNLQYQDATAATITNNQLFAETTGDFPASTTNFGVELASIQSAVGVTVTNNNSTGNVYGILIWNVPTTNTITVSGGTLTGNQYGVLATLNDPQFGAGAAGHAVISGVTVSSATVAGMLADGAGASMEVTGSTITSCAKGVVIRNGAVGNTITGNSIHDNAGLGIDLGDDGVTPNDSSDADSGPNNLQNFPIIATALVGTPNTISGTLNSTPGQTFTIHLYANPTCDSSGNGEGQTLIGSTTATTNGSGDAIWALNPGSLTVGDFITATATDSAGNTSEFSACFQARAFTPGTITFNQLSSSETNSNHDVNVIVSRTGGSDGAVSVQYNVTDGTATLADNDYSVAAPSGTLTWANGDASDRLITINVKGDLKFEADETVLLTLSNPTGGASTGGTNPALTITNDDTAPSFSINDVTHNEGNSGTTAYVFTITKTGNTALNAGVNFQTADNSATVAGNDYQSQTGSLTFLPGDVTKTVTVLVNGDTTVEPDETFSLNLSGATNATISDNQGVGTITNDDTDVTLSVSPASVSEDGAANLVYTFTRSGVVSNSLTVNFSVSGGATFSTDYSQLGATTFTNSSGTVTFGAGNTTAQVTVDPIADSTVEPDETVVLTLTAGTGYGVGTPGTATGTITNDDTDVSVAVSPSSVLEDGATNLVYTFTRNGVNTGPLTVNFAVAGTATFNSDYTQSGAATFSATNGSVTFAAGNPTATVTIDPTADVTVEPDETVILTVASGSGYGVGSPSSVTGTIVNDDGNTGGTIQFSATSYNTTESSFFTTITVQRTGDTTGAVSVDYATPDDSAATSVLPCSTVNGVASPRCDFTAAVGTLHWASGDNSPKSFIVLISQDDYVEGPEGLTLTLSNPTGGAQLGSQSTAILTIADDVNEPAQNPIDDPSDFVRQHYHDFLNREPDPSGFDFWVGNFPPCGGDPQCVEVKRINVSGAFYLSIEFQGTGFFIERLYKSSYGDATGTSTDGGPHQVAVPIVRFSELLPDTQEIGRGVVVLAPGWEAALEANKVAFTDQFVQRARFLNAYPLSMTPAQFVDALNANAGNPLSTAERDQLVSDLTGGAKTRAQVLRAVADDQDLINAEFNRGFVLMQYFGFLRRNPDAAPDIDHSGYDFWLKKLNSFNGDFVQAEMVKAFLASSEYRHRAGGN